MGTEKKKKKEKGGYQKRKKKELRSSSSSSPLSSHEEEASLINWKGGSRSIHYSKYKRGFRANKLPTIKTGAKTGGRRTDTFFSDCLIGHPPPHLTKYIRRRIGNFLIPLVLALCWTCMHTSIGTASARCGWARDGRVVNGWIDEQMKDGLILSLN